MPKILAETALLPDGWAENVLVELDEIGRIAKVTANVTDAAAKSNVSCLLPAPVNAHSHAFQRAMAGLTEHRSTNTTDSFWTWRELMYLFLDQLTQDHIEAIAALVQMEMLEAGYATNVEFHYLHHGPDGTPYDNRGEMANRIMAAAERTGIGLTLLPVHYQYGGCDFRPLTRGQCRFHNDLDGFADLCGAIQPGLAALPADTSIGVAPHSLRAVAPDSFAASRALARGGPFHMHLAEQLAEVEEVKQHLGARPVEWVLNNMEIDDSCCFIHCTQMQPHEIRGLAKSGALAGLCPITEANLGDGIFEGVRWLDSGGAIAIGSDSNIRISLSEEIRTLEYSQRLRDHSRAALASDYKSTGRRIFDEIVAGGANAAGRKTGKISVGYWADLLALDSNAINLAGHEDDTILDSFVFSGDDRLVKDVWSAGRHLIKNGRHVKSESLVNTYLQTMRSISGDM